MMRAIVLALGCLVALPAFGQSALQGKWNATVPGKSSAGVLLVDADSRVTYAPAPDNGGPPKYRGYVANIDERKAELIVTDGSTVAHLHCIVQSSDFMECRTHRPDRPTGDVFLLKREARDVAKLWAPSSTALAGAWRLLFDVPFDYSGKVIIDGRNRVELTALWGTHNGIPAGTATARGYARTDGTNIEIVFTEREPPTARFADRLICTRQAAHEMNCTTGAGAVMNNATKLGMVRTP